MANNKLSLIADLKNSFAPWRIKVRVFKFWEGIDPKTGGPSGLDYIFMDEQGSRIHGKVLKFNRERFVHKLEEGKIYILSKISVCHAEQMYRPTRREYMVFLNASTVVQEINEINGFPKYSFDFVKLNTLAEHKDNVFLNDIIGIFLDSSDVKIVKDNKIIREIFIQDDTTANVRVVLWGDLANNFVKPTNLSDKPIFILSSTSADFYRVTQRYSVSSRESSNYYFDLDIPEVRFLKNSQIEVGESSGGIDWTTNNRKTITAMLDDYKPNSPEVFYTCTARYSNFEGKYTYPACAKCTRKVVRTGGTLKCPRCTTPQSITQAIVSKISIHDISGTCIVSLFGNKAAEMLSIDLEELLEYEQLGVNLGDIFEQARGTDYIFEVKMSTYQDNMSLAINRTKVIHSIPDDDGPLDNEANNDDPPSFGMVSIKQEKDDDELQSNPQAYDDDDGNKHKVIHDIQDDDENKTDIAPSFRMVTIK
ncbi:hypothetical protein AQUCO_04300121v1 [Aquilegia coerulea]|uniref:Replication factor A C-terminal domain-containing protein n=1 Tax=Aquilegia coerulea TaxID=218851 RepID=A0A2G5CNU6_AQUCA|nr:hypothetical protein AQUCO_04300121v1 [Aquilegia coerulea]